MTEDCSTVTCRYGECKENPKELKIEDWASHLKKFHPKEYESFTKIKEEESTPEWQNLLEAECKKNNTAYVVLMVGVEEGKAAKYEIRSSTLDPFQVVGILWSFINKMR